MRASATRIVIVVAVVAALGWVFRGPLLSFLIFRPQPLPAAARGLKLDALQPADFTVVATDLEIPWEVAFLPDGSLLVTERPGRLLRLLGPERRVYPIAGVRHMGEAGLAGLALHPRFAENRWIYLYLTGEGGAGLENRVERYRFDVRGVSDRRVIVAGIPASQFHDGGRLTFGPDGYLYVTTGDATDGHLSQDHESLAGKVLRLTDEGTPAPGNPYGTVVWSSGHRNPQGLAWDEGRRLWATEHGRSGTSSGYDELNVIVPGGNYGWPVYEGDAAGPGTTPPVLHSGPNYTWAPAGAAFWDRSVFFGGLRGEALYEARLGSARPDLRIHFARELGRIRVVRMGPDGMLYLATSNRDGRGRVRGGDDRIVKVSPAVFRR